MHLFINEGTLLTISEGMRKLCDQEEERLGQIEHLIYNLGSEWQGEAEREYINSFVLVRIEYRNVIRELKNYAALLQSIVRDYTALDEKYAAKISAV